MKLFVVLNVNPSDTIQRVKEMIADREGTPADLLGLIFAGDRLEGSRTLADYNIQAGSAVKLQMLQMPLPYPLE